MPRRAKVFVRQPGTDPDWSDMRTVQAAARIEQVQRAARERYATDPWPFIRDCVSTLDQITGTVRHVPDKPHLEYLAQLWMLEPLLLVPKSRRMMVTWLFVALYYWMFRYRPHVKIAFFARKEGKNESEGSAELVWRAKFIHEHLPPVLGSFPVEYSMGRLYAPETGSEILGMAEGTDQARQMTLTGALCDEMAFWTHPYETYVSLRPTLEGGGKLTGVSSAAPGFFESLVHDQAMQSPGAFRGA